MEKISSKLIEKYLMEYPANYLQTRSDRIKVQYKLYKDSKWLQKLQSE